MIRVLPDTALLAEPAFYIELALTFKLSKPTQTEFGFGRTCSSGDGPRAVFPQTLLQLYPALAPGPGGAWVNARGTYPNVLTVMGPSGSKLSFAAEQRSFMLDASPPSVIRFQASTGDHVDVQVLGLDAVTGIGLSVVGHTPKTAYDIAENDSLMLPGGAFYVPSVSQVFAGSDGTQFCNYEPVALTLEAEPGSSCVVITEVPAFVSHPGPVLQGSGFGACRFTARAPALGRSRLRSWIDFPLHWCFSG